MKPYGALLHLLDPICYASPRSEAETGARAPYLGRRSSTANEVGRENEVPEASGHGVSVHADSFNLLSQLSVARSHLQRNDLWGAAQADTILADLERKIEDGTHWTWS